MPRAHHREVPGFSMGALTALGASLFHWCFVWTQEGCGWKTAWEPTGVAVKGCRQVQAGTGRFRAERGGSPVCPRTLTPFHGDWYFCPLEETEVPRCCSVCPGSILAFRKGQMEGRSPWQDYAMCRWTVLGLTHIHMVTREILLRVQC